MIHPEQGRPWLWTAQDLLPLPLAEIHLGETKVVVSNRTEKYFESGGRTLAIKFIIKQ